MASLQDKRKPRPMVKSLLRTVSPRGTLGSQRTANSTTSPRPALAPRTHAVTRMPRSELLLARNRNGSSRSIPMHQTPRPRSLTQRSSDPLEPPAPPGTRGRAARKRRARASHDQSPSFHPRASSTTSHWKGCRRQRPWISSQGRAELSWKGRGPEGHAAQRPPMLLRVPPRRGPAAEARLELPPRIRNQRTRASFPRLFADWTRSSSTLSAMSSKRMARLRNTCWSPKPSRGSTTAFQAKRNHSRGGENQRRGAPRT